MEPEAWSVWQTICCLWTTRTGTYQFGSFNQYFAEGTRTEHPGIINYPFWQAVYQNPEGSYACLNLGDAAAPGEIAERSLCIDGDIGEILEKLK